MNNIVNQVPFLRTSREFPEDLHSLAVQVNKSYIDIANAVNNRIIGIFTTNRPIITGESWFFTNQRQQTLRQFFPFGMINPGATLSINYTLSNLVQFSKIYGTCITAIPDNRPIPYASVIANENIELRVTPPSLTPPQIGQIIISNGAASPIINSGIIILEWLSQV